jgi:hypothetical protein
MTCAAEIAAVTIQLLLGHDERRSTTRLGSVARNTAFGIPWLSVALLFCGSAAARTVLSGGRSFSGRSRAAAGALTRAQPEQIAQQAQYRDVDVGYGIFDYVTPDADLKTREPGCVHDVELSDLRAWDLDGHA